MSQGIYYSDFHQILFYIYISQLIKKEIYIHEIAALEGS